MTRSRASAKQAGTRFESAIVSPADAYVVMDGETFTHLLKEAGY